MLIKMSLSIESDQRLYVKIEKIIADKEADIFFFADKTVFLIKKDNDQ